jgi:hypothetical protein
VFQQSTRKFDVLDKICRKVPLKLAFYGWINALEGNKISLP